MKISKPTQEFPAPQVDARKNNKGRKKGALRRTMEELEPGQSIFVESDDSNALISARVVVRNVELEKQWKMTARSEDNGIRIWRIA